MSQDDLIFLSIRNKTVHSTEDLNDTSLSVYVIRTSSYGTDISFERQFLNGCSYGMEMEAHNQCMRCDDRE